MPHFQNIADDQFIYFLYFWRIEIQKYINVISLRMCPNILSVTIQTLGAPLIKLYKFLFLDLRQNCQRFEEIPGLVDIVDVAAGLRHAAAVDKVPHSDFMVHPVLIVS